MSVVRLPSPPDPFPPLNIYRIPAGTILHRTHARDLDPCQFNPGFGGPTRFAPFADAAGDIVPTIYAGTSREAAVFESIFHDIEPTAAFKTVRLDVVTRRSVSQIVPQREIALAALFAPDLKAWGLARTDLIETPKSTYDQTATWAKAVHAADATVDGLIWTSRQCDPGLCVVLFGDRVASTDIITNDRQELSTNATLLLEIREYGLRAGITLVS